MSTLEQQLAKLKLGDHVCLLYEDAAEALAAAVAFIAVGLSRGEQCLYISEQWAAGSSGELAVDQLAGALVARGVDARAERERGALLLRPTFDHGFPSGAFDPDELIAYLHGMANDAVAAGFAGLRLVAEMPWTWGMASAHDNLIIYEALWNELVATSPIVGLCQYSRLRFAPEIQREALRTHPLAVVGGCLCQNLYYEPPSLVVDPAAVAARVDWMIAQLVQTCLAQDQLTEAVARYRSIFERTSDGLLLLDADGRIVEANPALCRMHGYTAEELIGQSPTMLIQPEFQTAVAALFHAADQPVSAGVVDRRKDGSALHVRIHAVSFRPLGRPHLLWVMRDVTAPVEARLLLERRVDERTHELSALLEVARSLSSTLELEPLLELILKQLRGVVDFTAAAIRMVQGEDFVVLDYQGPTPREQVLGQSGHWLTTVGREIVRRRAPVIVDDMRGESPLARGVQDAAGALLATTYSYLRSWLGVPLLLKERVLGILSLTHVEPGYYTTHHAELAMAVASHAAMAIENAQLYQQVQDVAVSEERARIAREMHDSLAQMLFYVNTQAEAVRTRLQKGQTEQATEQLEQLAQAAREAYSDVREDILALRSAGTTRGLMESLHAYLPLWQEQSGVHAELEITPAEAELPAVPTTVAIQLVRIVQQALANVRQHAHARQVKIRIGAEAGHVSVVVEDDGVGFDPATRGQHAAPHVGLAMMRERAAAVGGRLEIESAPGRGTRVLAQVPVQVVPPDAERRA